MYWPRDANLGSLVAAAMASAVRPAARQQRLFIGEAMSELAAHLASFDFLAGVDLRPSLRLVGLEPDRWWLAELRPTQRTIRPSDQGPVAVSLPAIVQATTGRRRLPADAKAWKPLFAPRSTTRLAARLEEESQALFALYEYGALHRGVRIRRRPGDRLLPVAWSLAGDPDIEAFVGASSSQRVPVEIVIGPSADLSDPWPRAVTVTIVERDGDVLYVREGDDIRALDPCDIRTIRFPAGPATPNVGPRRDGWLRKAPRDSLRPAASRVRRGADLGWPLRAGALRPSRRQRGAGGRSSLLISILATSPSALRARMRSRGARCRRNRRPNVESAADRLAPSESPEQAIRPHRGRGPAGVEGMLRSGVHPGGRAEHERLARSVT